jgi:hypothetical protein
MSLTSSYDKVKNSCVVPLILIYFQLLIMFINYIQIVFRLMSYTTWVKYQLSCMPSSGCYEEADRFSYLQNSPRVTSE